ncbi:hypothetical protein AMECASPLE_029900 [Ameca splendens]|uniref:Uncharacterized protein n=1 Tax=Ameca splendens TaxID=208324 RepID=A0ABV1AC85_9TELE
MIAHDLVCGLLQHRRQSARPRTPAAGPLLRSSARMGQGVLRTNRLSAGVSRGGRDLRKTGRIVRKA